MVVHPPPILSKIFMHLPSPPCPCFTPAEAMFPSSPLILSHTSSPLSCAHSSLMHAWPPPIVAIHQHIPILSNLHTYPCTSPPSYPCKLSTFVYPSPHVHANLPCSHTLSNMHGHPPWTLSLTTYSSPVHLSPSIPNSLIFFLITFSLSTPQHNPLTTFSLSTPHHMSLTTFSLSTPRHASIPLSMLSHACYHPSMPTLPILSCHLSLSTPRSSCPLPIHMHEAMHGTMHATTLLCPPYPSFLTSLLSLHHPTSLSFILEGKVW